MNVDLPTPGRPVTPMRYEGICAVAGCSFARSSSARSRCSGLLLSTRVIARPSAARSLLRTPWASALTEIDGAGEFISPFRRRATCARAHAFTPDWGSPKNDEASMPLTPRKPAHTKALAERAHPAQKTGLIPQPAPGAGRSSAQTRSDPRSGATCLRRMRPARWPAPGGRCRPRRGWRTGA